MSKSMKNSKFFGENRSTVSDGGLRESKLERKIKVSLLFGSDLEKISIEWSEFQNCNEKKSQRWRRR